MSRQRVGRPDALYSRKRRKQKLWKQNRIWAIYTGTKIQRPLKRRIGA